jgi:ribosomal-protein-alanine N-acetyltransferase
LPEHRAREIEFPIGGIDDGVIRLRFRTDADLAAIVAAVQDPEIPRWTRVPYDYDEGTAREWAELSVADQQEGRGLHLLVVDANDDRLLGSCGIVAIDWEEFRCDIGYWAVAAERGRGVIPRAIRLLSRWIFDELPMERIGIQADPENAASRRVAEKAGFTYEGVLRSWYLNKGRRHDAASYSLLRGELR